LEELGRPVFVAFNLKAHRNFLEIAGLFHKKYTKENTSIQKLRWQEIGALFT
jgi:hypothetical protein